MKSRAGDMCVMSAVILSITVAVIGATVIQDRSTETLYTEDWNEARHFARECEEGGGSYHMRPHWHKHEDKPYAATIICQRSR